MKKSCLKFALAVLVLLGVLFGAVCVSYAADGFCNTKTAHTTAVGANTFSVSFYEKQTGMFVVFACYNEEKLVFTDTATYNGEASIPFTPQSGVTYDEVKVYCFKSASSLTPMGKAETVALSDLVIADPQHNIYTTAIDGETVTFRYWDAKDTLQYIKFANASETTLYLNGDTIGTLADREAADIFLSELTYYGDFTLRAHDGVYDEIYLTEYIYGIVDEIDADEMSVTTTANDSFSFNMDDHLDEFSYTIYKDGAVAEFSDLAVGDMLNIITDNEDFEDALFAEIYVTNITLNGTVSAVSSDSHGEIVYTIDDNDYYLCSMSLISSMKAGDTGTFYLTVDGYIYDADFSESTRGNYAFILDIAKDSTGFGSEWQLKLLTQDNTKVIYSVNSTVKVTTSNGMYSSYKDSAQDVVFDPIRNAVASWSINADDLHARMITYALNADGKISEIAFAQRNGSSRDFNYRSFAGSYNAKTESLAAYDMLSSTIIFNAPVESDGFLNEDKVQVYTIDSLDEDKTDDYKGFVFDVDSDGAAGAVLITNDMGFAGRSKPLAVVKSISIGLDANGEAADVINFYQAGEMKSLAITGDTYLGTLDAYMLSSGDVFQYTTNLAGEINNAQLVYDFDMGAETGRLEKSKDGDISYVTGLVTEAANSVTLSNGSSYAWDLQEGYTNVLLNVERAKSYINRAFTGYGTKTDYIKAATVNASGYITSDAYVIFAKVDDDSIVEVVTYQFMKDATRPYDSFVANFE